MKEYFFRVWKEREEDPSWRVSLSIDGAEQVQGIFKFDPSPDAAFVPLSGFPDPQIELDLKDLEELGNRLWSGLLGSPSVNEAFQKSRSRDLQVGGIIRLDVPREIFVPEEQQSFPIPWEVICRAKDAGLLEPWSIVHDAGEAAQDGEQPVAGEPAWPRTLVIVPRSSKLNVTTETQNLKAAFRQAGAAAYLTVCHEKITPAILEQRLAERERWDIVHFIGHGDITGGRVGILLNKPEDSAATGDLISYDGEALADLLFRSRPRLVVMNCCHSEGVTSRGLYAGFGPILRRRGIPATATMRYAVENGVAASFSDRLYRELLGGRDPGRVDRAVEIARRSLFTNGLGSTRDPLLPVLHLARGCHQLFAFPPAAGSSSDAGESALGAAAISTGDIPLLDKLIEAIVEDRCVVVAGPGIYSESAVRDTVSPSAAPLILAELLASFGDPSYPLERKLDDLDLCAKAGGWLDSHLLQWITQHIVTRDDGRGNLDEKIAACLSEMEVPNTCRQLARWPLKAIFYTHFDGFLKRLVDNREGRLQCTVTKLDSAPPSVDGGIQAPRCLVLLRGDSSMPVVTEEDHDALASDIAKMDRQIATLAKAPKRAVLFLGVNPRDSIVRQLAQKILDHRGDRNRTQGLKFFATEKHDRVDDAYWSQYNMKWLPAPSGQLVALITEELRKAGKLG